MKGAEPTLSRADLAQVLEWQKQALKRMGVTDRIEKVGAVLRGPFFFRLAKREIHVREAREGRFKTLDPVRDLAMRILAQEFGLDLDGVDLQVRWDDKTKVLNYRAAPSPPVMQRVTNEAMQRLRAKKQR